MWESKPDLASEDPVVNPGFPFNRLCVSGHVTNPYLIVRELTMPTTTVARIK